MGQDSGGRLYSESSFAAAWMRRGMSRSTVSSKKRPIDGVISVSDHITLRDHGPPGQLGMLALERASEAPGDLAQDDKVVEYRIAGRAVTDKRFARIKPRPLLHDAGGVFSQVREQLRVAVGSHAAYTVLALLSTSCLNQGL